LPTPSAVVISQPPWYGRLRTFILYILTFCYDLH
jgi:hypothetical protein